MGLWLQRSHSTAVVEVNQTPGESPTPHEPDRVRDAVVSARLTTEEEYAEALAHVGRTEGAATASEIADELCSRGVLTDFQADHLMSGRWDELLIGDYVVRRPLSRGGMGQLYEAWHPALRRLVAVKSIAIQGLAANDELRRRFDREMHVCGRLSHPNIVTIHDAVLLPSGPWLVMELLEGRDLRQEVAKRGPMPPQQAVDLVVQAAQGLAHAHRSGVVHRDVKPANLFLESSGSVRVLDFGLAFLYDAVPAAMGPQPLTRTGVIMGTAEFMAPEQSDGERQVDARADIYSLGCSIYFLLTGRTPYSGKSHIEQILAHREQAVPNLPDSLDAPALNRVVCRMLEKNPALRQQTMNEVIDDLSGLLPLQRTSATSAALLSTQKLPTYVAPAVRLDARGQSRRPWYKIGGVVASVAAMIAVAAALAIWPPDWNGSSAVGPPAQNWDTLRRQLEQANPGLEIPPDAYGREGAEDPWTLDLSGLNRLRTLVPLGDVPIDALYLNQTSVDDLGPIAASQLSFLEFGGTKVRNLTPLRGMPLTSLVAWRTQVNDLAPLRGMPLTYLDIHGTRVADLSPLADSRLEELDVHATQVEDLSVVAKMPLVSFDGSQTPISSVEALSECPLQRLWCDANQLHGMDVLETWPHLLDVNEVPIDDFLGQRNE